MPRGRPRRPAAPAAPATAPPSPPGPSRHELALSAFAVVSLVLAERYQPRFLFFPVHGFHLALVFFAAGHLATAEQGLRARLSRVLAGARANLGGYYALSLLFGLATLLLTAAGLPPGGALPALAPAGAALESIRSFALAPFGAGEAYALFRPGWILVQLFVVGALFQLAGLAAHRLLLGGALAAALVATLALLGDGGAEGPALFAGRTAFAALFYLLGFAAKSASETVRRWLTAPAAAVAGFLAADALYAWSGPLVYRLEAGSLGKGPPLATLLATAALVLLVYQLAWFAAGLVGEGSALFALGRASRAVLVWHPSAFFATNCVFLLLGLVSREQLSVALSHDLNRTWLFYLVPALALPVLGQRLARRLLGRPIGGVLS